MSYGDWLYEKHIGADENVVLLSDEELDFLSLVATIPPAPDAPLCAICEATPVDTINGICPGCWPGMRPN